MKNTTDIVDAPMHQPETDYHFSFGSYFPPQFKIFGVICILIGVAICISSYFGGLIFLGLGLVLLLSKKELSLSFSLSKYKHSLRLFNFRSGTWETLPEFESISIFSAKKSQAMSVGPQTQTATFTEIEVNLVYKRSRRLTVYTTSNYDEALNTARVFASKFSLDIYDATSREGKWIE
jgi:hypothetical protein